MQNFAAPFEPAFLPAVSVVATDSWQSLLQQDSETLVVTVTEEQVAEAEPGGTPKLQHPCVASLNSLAAAAVDAAVHMHTFRGKQGEVLPPVMVPANEGQICSVVLLGLGKRSGLLAQQWGANPFHAAGAALAAAAKTYNLTAVQVAISSLPAADQTAAALSGFTAAALSGLYEGNVRFKSKGESKVKLQTVQLLLHSEQQDGSSSGVLAAAAARGVALARGTLTTRFLVEAPANVCTPSHLAAAADHIAALDPAHFSLQVLDEAACRQLGMGLFVGVSQGSDEPLKLIHLTYTPDGPVQHKIALVGKGVTFDSGGYNLKVQGGIETMKCDMGGAGAVLGAARALLDLQPQGLQVHFISAACENMVSGRATRPSDIHVSAAGKTVEVNDTDAEGRLTLADALWYAQEKAGATTVVDIATLTGAAGIALGQDTGALFAASDGLAQALDAASRRAGEKLWRLPLNEGLVKKLESPIADLKNYAGSSGGAITAALFLQEFVDEGVEWGHLDVAGPAWDDAACLPTGFGAATLAEWVMAQQHEKQH